MRPCCPFSQIAVMSYPSEVRVTLIGKTGVGKSAVGNTILGRKRFARGSGSSSVTRRCQKESAVVAYWTVAVVDTPDFFYSTHEEDLVSEIDRSVTLSSPGVHAFIYVLKPSTFTELETETVSKFKEAFGEEVFRHTVILFTHGDQLHQVDMDMLISQNESLRDFVTHCGGRFTVLNNEAPEDRDQVYYLLDIINRMVTANENSFYTLEMLQEARRRAEEHRESSLAQERRQEESARIKHQMDLERAIRETEVRVRKEIEEEQKKTRTTIVEATKYSTKEETETRAEQELQKRDRKLNCSENKGKYRFILQTSRLYIIVFFSVAFGCIFNVIYPDRWAWVPGGVLGALAAAGGFITGVALVRGQRSHFPDQWKKLFFTTCGGLTGSLILYIGTKETSFTVLGFLAGGFPAYTALRAHG